MIGFDIDDVLFESFKSLKEYILKFHNIEIKEPDRFTKFLDDIFPEDDLNNIFNSCLGSYEYMYPNKECIDFINELHSRKIQDKFIFVTARPKELEENTEKLIKRYLPTINFKTYHCGDGSKIQHLKENNIQYFVEDRYKNADEIAKSNIFVFLRRRPWNVNRMYYHKIMPFSSFEVLKPIFF